MAENDLRKSDMMAHLLDALEKGEDIGHYGRLVFTMVARHFMKEDEVVDLLERDRDFGRDEAIALYRQVESRGYSPPKRERILEWQEQQDFAICPNPGDPDSCNVYRDLRFPDEVYEDISEYHEEKAKS